ncbi:MAG: hypothetical protein RLY78_2688 [Pseudomonadota bacterium]|jgi:HPt (histidine-containing phosphotransfer) domain-containing protein
MSLPPSDPDLPPGPSAACPVALSVPSPSVAAGGSGAARLDPSALAQLERIDTDGELLLRVLRTYLSTLHKTRPVLRAWAADLDGHFRAVHTLKSSSASIGALAVSELCASIEQALRDGRVDDVGRLTSALLHEITQVELAVRVRLNHTR